MNIKQIIYALFVNHPKRGSTQLVQAADSGSTRTSACSILPMGYCRMPAIRKPVAKMSTPPQAMKSPSMVSEIRGINSPALQKSNSINTSWGKAMMLTMCRRLMAKIMAVKKSITALASKTV